MYIENCSKLNTQCLKKSLVQWSWDYLLFLQQKSKVAITKCTKEWRAKIYVGVIQGRIQEFEKGGGGHNTPFFFGPPPASKLAQVPKKLIMGGGGGGGGGTPTLFFRSATYVESRASSNRGIGGWNQTLFFFFFKFFFIFIFRFQKWGHMYKNVSKGGHGPGVPPPPPKSATGVIAHTYKVGCT